MAWALGLQWNMQEILYSVILLEGMRAKVGPGLALGGMRHLREFKIWRYSSDVYYWIDSHTTMVDCRLTSHSGGWVGGNLATKRAERERGGGGVKNILNYSSPVFHCYAS
jgi:hypothetical protein